MRENEFVLGEHNAAIEQLLQNQQIIQRDIGEIRQILAERRGERRVALWVASAGGAILVFLVRFVAGYLGVRAV